MKDAWTGLQPRPMNGARDIPQVEKWAITSVGANFVQVTDGQVIAVEAGLPTVENETVSFNIPVPSSLIGEAAVGDWVHVIAQGQHCWAFAINSRDF